MSETPSGLTESQAKEFHRGFVTSFAIYVLIAIIAHVLVWNWRPWFPGTDPYESVGSVWDTISNTAVSVLTLVA